MQKIIALAASACTAIATLGCSVVGIRSGYEEPAFEVLEVFGDHLEVRRYGPRLVIETDVEMQDEAQARSETFRILAAYIFGENEGERKVAMTVPVETEARPTEIAMTVPVQTQSDGERMRMRFYAPSEYTRDTLPKPKDPRVRFDEAPGETLAVLRFSGRGRPAAVESRVAELRAALVDSAWVEHGEPRALFYDPPWTLPFLRRNEVAVPVSARE